MEQPIVLTIGGWDPCGGAGLAADIKTMEMNGVTGMGIATAITYQSADCFYGLRWIDIKDIGKQLHSIVSQYTISAIKIGIIENTIVLTELLNRIQSALDNSIPIVWDPVLKATAGYEFHSQPSSMLKLLNRITLLTPNTHEFESIFGQIVTAHQLNSLIISNKWSSILLKGGHAEGHANDLLLNGTDITEIPGERFDVNGKHGSGCVLSSAIASNLAKGMPLLQACQLAKAYTERFLKSSATLLGSHKDCINTLDTVNYNAKS
jgi:hydroxymethylpyrimidine/phosphomethylpyrimidine kinase